MDKWIDFYDILNDSIKSNSVDKLVSELNGDPNVALLLAPEDHVMKIKPEAFYKKLSSKDSLEYIFDSSRKSGFEIPFSGLIDESILTLFKTFKGCTGNKSFCYWTHGTLLDRSREYALNNDFEVGLGHSHPVNRGNKYGALCSNISYTRKELEGFKDETSKKILESGLYEKYGGDYCEMLVRSKDKLMSKYFIIMSPKLGQMGIFRLEEGGRTIFHRWTVCD